MISSDTETIVERVRENYIGLDGNKWSSWLSRPTTPLHLTRDQIKESHTTGGAHNDGYVRITQVDHATCSND